MEAMNSSPCSQVALPQKLGREKKINHLFFFGLQIYQKVSILEHFVLIFSACDDLSGFRKWLIFSKPRHTYRSHRT